MVALGGITEIGRNMTVYEYDGRLLVVDCGVLFPEDGQPGVDLILPDLRLVELDCGIGSRWLIRTRRGQVVVARLGRKIRARR